MIFLGFFGIFLAHEFWLAKKTMLMDQPYALICPGKVMLENFGL